MTAARGPSAPPVLVRCGRPVTLVGGGPVAPADIGAALAVAPEIVGADSGGDLELPTGHEFRAVIGDLDSLAGGTDLARRGVALYRLDEQESTDLEKCLYSVAAPLFVGIGFLGGRPDHALAAMNAVVRARTPLILLGCGQICFACPPDLVLDLPPGTEVSLFPLAPVRGLGSEGLRWPIAGLAFAPDGRIGTSNAATGGRVRIRLDGPGMLALLPAAALGAAVAALAPTLSSR